MEMQSPRSSMGESPLKPPSLEASPPQKKEQEQDQEQDQEQEQEQDQEQEQEQEQEEETEKESQAAISSEPAEPEKQEDTGTEM